MTTLLVNADQHEDTVRRILLFAQMMVVVLLTIGGDALDPHGELVAPLYGLLLVLVAALHERTRRTRPDLAAFAGRRRTLCAVAGVVVALSGRCCRWSARRWRGWWWLLHRAPVLLGRIDRGDERPVLNLHHLVDRLAALTTIVLGEAFVKVALVASTTHLSGINFVVLCLEFITVFAVWLSYFDDFAHAGMPTQHGRQRLWMIAHLPLHLAIIGMAVGIGAFEALKTTSELTEVDVFSSPCRWPSSSPAWPSSAWPPPAGPTAPWRCCGLPSEVLVGLVGAVVVGDPRHHRGDGRRLLRPGGSGPGGGGGPPAPPDHRRLGGPGPQCPTRAGISATESTTRSAATPS